MFMPPGLDADTKNKAAGHAAALRKVRDSNPRYGQAVQRISSPPRSITPATFQYKIQVSFLKNFSLRIECKSSEFLRPAKREVEKMRMKSSSVNENETLVNQ